MLTQSISSYCGEDCTQETNVHVGRDITFEKEVQAKSEIESNATGNAALTNHNLVNFLHSNFSDIHVSSDAIRRCTVHCTGVGQTSRIYLIVTGKIMLIINLIAG